MVHPPYNGKVVRVGTMSCSVAMSKDGWGFFETFLIFLPKGPGCLTYVFITIHELPTLLPIDSPILFVQGSLSLGLTSIILIVLFPLKWVWIPYLLHMFLMLSPSPCVYGMTVSPVVSLLGGVSSLRPHWCCQYYLYFVHSGCFPHYSLPGFTDRSSILFKAHLGYLHLVRASEVL